MIENVRKWAAERGYQAGWGPLEVVDAALSDVASRGLPPALAEYASESIASEPAESMAARGFASVLVVVKPRPAHRVAFETERGTLETQLPPTYFHYRPVFEEVREDLARTLPGARFETLNAPLKQVAARLGLVSYGRNNVTYAPGVGSWFQLCGYLTDARLPVPDLWRLAEPTLLSRCLRCRACVKLCPTGAIPKDEVFIDATRCLTFANELPGAWPEWVKPKSHNALLGCLACQKRCPENPELPVEPSGVTFTREETRALLAEPEDRETPAWRGVRAKLAVLGQPYSEDVLGRNVRALAALSD